MQTDMEQCENAILLLNYELVKLFFTSLIRSCRIKSNKIN